MKKLQKIIPAVILALLLSFVPAKVLAEGEEGGEEPTFAVTYDFHGGATFNGKSTYSRRSVGVAPEISESNLISCFEYDAALDECHSITVKKGKELDHVTVNGEELQFGDFYMLDKDTTIVYYWNDLELDNYDISDDKGNSITFDEAEGHHYNLEVNFFSFSMTDEELASFDPPLSREEYEAGKSAITGAVADKGDVVAYFEIEVWENPTCGNGPCMCTTDQGEVPCVDNVHEGPFEIKIKFTDDLAGFKAYKFVNVEIDENGNATVGETVELTLVDGYLVGTLPHLSGYALIGSNNVSAPDTGSFQSFTDAAAIFPFLSILGLAVFAGLAFALKKATTKI